jgi:uncharacterized protein
VSEYYPNISDSCLDVCIKYVYYFIVEVEWDPDEARNNLEKHGVHFSDAEIDLYDPTALTREDTRTEGEQRFVSIGSDAISHILIVVYTYRRENIRMISACPATKSERRSYEERI